MEATTGAAPRVPCPAPRITLLSERDFHRARIEMLRELTGHDPPPPRDPAADPAAAAKPLTAGPAGGQASFDLLALALAAHPA